MKRLTRMLVHASSVAYAPRFGVLRLMLAIVLGAWLLTRLTLLAVHGALRADGLVPTILALGHGGLADLRAALWLLLPLTLYLVCAPGRWFRSRLQHVLLAAGVLLAIYATVFVAAAEYIFFDEFDGRFNFVAVDYLIYPTEVTVNLWQSYPVAAILAALLAVTLLAGWLLRARLADLTRGATPFRTRIAGLAGYATVLAALSLALPDSLAHVSDDRALNEIAGNGYEAFWQALRGQDAPYEGLYAAVPERAALHRLPPLLEEPAVEPGSFVAGSAERVIRAVTPEHRLNVVVLLEESFGSEFVGALQPDGAGVTPEFDALAAQGTLLANAFSTGNRTIRALEATTASLPPLPGVSIVRRPASRNLFTLPALLRERGYHTMFIYGGRALFDGMGAYMRNNGVERIIEQKDFPADAFHTAWGVADEVIFDRALQEMDSLAAGGAPFYTLVLSVSNHKPYRFPEDEITPLPGLSGRRNAVRYADHALGAFMREAREHAFFDNTLFVIMGDHGARVYGSAEIPLDSYEVPILFLAPKWVPAGRRVETLASSLDVPPTILALLGVDYTSKFFGHDVLDIPAARGRALMTHNNEIALMRDSTIAVLGLHGAAKAYRHHAGVDSMVPIPVPSAEDREVVADAIAYFESADWLYRTGMDGLDDGERTARHAAGPAVAGGAHIDSDRRY